MNLFILDKNPAIAAKYLCDAHISKMLTESAQMLANCFDPNILVGAPKTVTGKVRGHTHINHPCSKWVRQSHENLEWLAVHALSMEKERLQRNMKPHGSVPFVRWASNHNPYEKIGLTPFAIAINEESKCRQSAFFEKCNEVGKYRLYYKYDKPFARWRYSLTPDWMFWSDEKIYHNTEK